MIPPPSKFEKRAVLVCPHLSLFVSEQPRVLQGEKDAIFAMPSFLSAVYSFIHLYAC
jgi:hypothetical protein